MGSFTDFFLFPRTGLAAGRSRKIAHAAGGQGVQPYCWRLNKDWEREHEIPELEFRTNFNSSYPIIFPSQTL